MAYHKATRLGFALSMSAALVGLSLTSGQAEVEAKSKVRELLVSFLTFNSQYQVQSEEARGLLTGEAKTRWKLESVGLLPTQPDRVVILGAMQAASAVVNVSGDFETDVYFYFEKEGENWKISSMRSMARTGMTQYIVMAAEEVKSPEISEASLDNMRLQLKSDRQLSEWFAEHRKKFDQLLPTIGDAFPQETHVVLNDSLFGDNNAPPAHDSKTYPDLVELLRKLRVSSAEIARDEIRITIGGILDDTVGILYSPTNSPPSIDANDHIWVQKLADKWYLYRTT